MKIFDWIKQTDPEDRNIAQWFVLYACTWGLFGLSLVGLAGMFGWMIHTLVVGITAITIMRMIIVAACVVFGMIFSCATLRYFDMW